MIGANGFAAWVRLVKRRGTRRLRWPTRASMQCKPTRSIRWSGAPLPNRLRRSPRSRCAWRSSDRARSPICFRRSASPGCGAGCGSTTYENDYGQYWQELADPKSGLHRFKPNAVLLALDAHHLASGVSADTNSADVEAALKATCERIRNCWRLAREAFRCPVIHQLALPVHPPLLGNNEHRLSGSRAGFIAALNAELRQLADSDGVDVLALDRQAATRRHRRLAQSRAVAPRQAGGHPGRRADLRRPGHACLSARDAGARTRRW